MPNPDFWVAARRLKPGSPLSFYGQTGWGADDSPRYGWLFSRAKARRFATLDEARAVASGPWGPGFVLAGFYPAHR